MSNGSNQLILQREFSDGINSATGSVRFQIISMAGSGQALATHADLYFLNGGRDIAVSRNQAPRAKLELSSTGAGFMRGFWEIARPPSTLSNPVFTPFKLETDTLAGTVTRTYTRPILPVDPPGTYLVRFRFLQPTNQIVPAIRYRVSAGAGGYQVTLISPTDGALANENTLFSWGTTPQVTYSSLQLFDRPSLTTRCGDSVSGTA